MVFDVKKFSVHDGPGIRTTVFFKGCPLDCWWCHNPESQSLKPELMFQARRCIRCEACLPLCTQGAIAVQNGAVYTDGDKCILCGDCVRACYAQAREMVGREMTVTQVMAEVEQDVAFYDESGGGVTFSGGEPLSQRAFLLALLRACREKEIHTVLDTCGFAPWEALDSVRQYVDLFLYDVKLVDGDRHCQYTGVPNDLILSNLRALAERGHSIVLRVPIVPGVNDAAEDVRQIGKLAADLGLERVDILPYHHIAAEKYVRLNKVYRLDDVQAPLGESLAEITQILQGFGLQVQRGG